MEKERLRKIYSVHCNYDGHFIADMLKNANKIDFNRDLLKRGEIFSVEKQNYHTTLNFITSELLRRNPTEKTTWFDYNEKERQYDRFCFGVIKLKDEFMDESLIDIIKDSFTNVFSEDETKSTGVAPINIEITKDGYVLLEGSIYYDDLPTFWNDLRYGGLNKVFSERQNYCANTIKNNFNKFRHCTESIYFNDIDGYYDDELDNFDSISDSILWEEHNNYTKMLKID